MNWHRGLMRVWLIATAVWVSICLWKLDVLCSGLSFECFDLNLLAIELGGLEHQGAWTYGYGAVAVTLGIPALVMAIGHFAAWIARGFRADIQ
jgi:hypothetical protein